MIAAASHARVAPPQAPASQRPSSPRPHEEVEHEPIPGLPEELPAGEEILWQGRPAWRRLARDAFHVRGLAVYLGLATLARGLSFVVDGASLPSALFASAQVLPLVVVALGIAAGLAWLHARATVYTITTRRVVVRIGVALPITFNLPFKQLASAGSRVHADGSGDVVLELAGDNRLGFIFLWPHARPWRFTRAEPMLRSIPDVADVARTLGDAVRSALLTRPTTDTPASALDDRRAAS